MFDDIDYDDIEKIADLLKIEINVYTPRKTTKNDYKVDKCSMTVVKTEFGPKSSEGVYRLLKINDHYDIVTDPSYFNKGLCRICSHWINLKDTNHWDICKKCPKCNRATTNNAEHTRDCTGPIKRKIKNKDIAIIEEQNQNLVEVFEPIKAYTVTKEDISFKHNVHFADFECFPKPNDPNRNYVVYAAAIISIISEKSGKDADNTMDWHDKSNKFQTYRVFYGENALDLFMQYLKSLKGVIYFWNGSSFDNFFMLRYMLINQWKFESKKIVINNNRLISMPITKDLKVRDLMLYIAPMSLSAACDGFSIPPEYSKGSFDHRLINSFEDAEKHRTEVTEYLKNDVISLLFIYKSYAQEIYNIFEANLTSAMTLSHLSYMIWSSMLSRYLPKSRIYKLPIPIYRKIIGGYYGGRVLLQQQVWKSKDYDKIIEESTKSGGFISKETFDELDDYYMKLDVVSLYPSVMEKNYYPTGKWKFIENQVISQHYYDLINDVSKENEHQKLIINVDIDCPTDIYIPFLMSRENGKLVQNLLPKKNQVYYCPEVVHALTLGYTLLKINWIMEFESSDQIFYKYISKFWEMKKNSRKGTAKYLAAKGTGNALSGKFGQIEHETETRIRSIDEINEDLDVLGYEPIYNDDEMIALITTEKVIKEYTTYPSYISICILAYSRIRMSKSTLQFNGYRNPKKTPLYGDTDSLIVHASTKNRISDMGSELGDLDDELGGGKVIMFVGLAPKTYNTLYVSSKLTDKGYEVLSSTRCKGIPHTAQSINLHLIKTNNEDDIKLDEIENFMSTLDTGLEMPIADCGLKGVIYVLEDELGEKKIVKHIGGEEMLSMINDTIKITAYYRTIRKTVRQNGTRTAINITSGFAFRQIFAKNWWKDNQRRNTPVNLFTISTPIGFNK